MARETIIIEIDEKANVVVSVKGVKGKGCAALTEDIESALGAVKSKTKTSEYSQTASASNKAVQK